MKLTIFFPRILWLLLVLISSVAAAQPRQPIIVGDLEVFYGGMPAEVLRGHPA